MAWSKQQLELLAEAAETPIEYFMKLYKLGVMNEKRLRWLYKVILWRKGILKQLPR